MADCEKLKQLKKWLFHIMDENPNYLEINTTIKGRFIIYEER